MLALGSACGGAAPTPPRQPAVATVPPAPQTGEAESQSDRVEDPDPTPRSEWRDGLPVVAQGKISDRPWQHLVGSVEGKTAEYFDLQDGSQIIVYVTETPDCPEGVRVSGKVIEIRGASKRPGEAESKAGGDFSELHIDVASFRCVP